ncbi:hypothetical protein PVAND_012568 [Polypedilum vanderplanki]|uniref:C2H2-type domain-containing protein n=1 Tax=Polypedilum vanderplanki TaxID=319348 RepID=A0A9J6CNU2_POLVA|nr:hypothetical protein PVAND_012568 [Polypedilum vanderplanki]
MELVEDDSHLCIRCKETIIGLQNYVNHRQSNCGAQAKSSSSKQQQFSSNFSFLDSHTNKKMQSYEHFNFGDEREMEEDDDEEEELMEEDEDEESDDSEISGVEQNNKSTESEYKEYDYDFFSSLELQYMSKNRNSPATTAARDSGGKKFNHHRIMTRKATAAAIMAQNGDEWIDDTSVGINKKRDYGKYYQNESNESDSDDSEPATAPPRNYTRGKWKPGSQWKSTTNWDENESDLDKSFDDTNPPPHHTQGKWIPGTKISRLEFKDEKIDEKSERDSFWCRWCSRNLATRAIYERHLKSNLHKKRTRQQNELEGAGEKLNELSTHFDERKKKSLEEEKIIEIESEILDRATATSTPITRTTHDDIDDDGASNNVYNSASEEEQQQQHQKLGIKKSKKFRSRTKITCEECDMKLPVHLFGCHLISHFHYRKMLLNPKKSFDTVLNNFHKIVIQSPFQCHPCKFYFNTREEFTRHWNSIEHTTTVSKLVGGKFLCSSFCKFECVSNAEMTEHLESAEHQQVVTLINRSKPIIIRYITRLFCPHCQQEFRYNIQLMRHSKSCELKKMDKFQFDAGATYGCDVCEKFFQSGLSLQKHKIKAHKVSIFFCSECQLTFNRASEAKAHRRTNQHKMMAIRKRILNDPHIREQMKKKCQFCGLELMDIIELKEHINIKHPERKFSCGRCGMKFAIAQEISRHVRDKLCKFYNTNRAEQSTTCTITSNEGGTEKAPEVEVESAETSTSKQTFALITSDSIKYPSTENDDDKVHVTTVANDEEEESPSQGIEMDNFDLLSSAFQISNVTNNETDVDDDNEFGMIIGEIDNKMDGQIVEILFTCKICEFSTESHAEFLFHEILHDTPDEQKSTIKLQCSICKKFFRKQSLREHLRQHTNERIFNCPITSCPMSFTRKANLKNHIRNIHRKDTENPTSSSTFVCKICGKKFLSKFFLDQHKFIHRKKIETKTSACQISSCIYVKHNSVDAKNHLLGNNDEKLFICTQPNCDYQSETMEQLKSHSHKHQEIEFRFNCEHCDYKTKLSSHLKRHMRIHEADRGKIYKCNFCDYACNNSENLRKHVLHSNKHQGRFMYECIYCGDDENLRFKCNYMREYQKHLLEAHNISKKS